MCRLPPLLRHVNKETCCKNGNVCRMSVAHHENVLHDSKLGNVVQEDMEDFENVGNKALAGNKGT